jgi:hypothetical protein
MSAKAQNGISPEIQQAIDYAVGAAYAQAQKVQSVLANHAILSGPVGTTAISSTVETALIGTVQLTAKSTGKFRITIAGTFTPTNTTTGAVVTPQISYQIGTATPFTAYGCPGITLDPAIAASVGGQTFSWVVESNLQSTTSSICPVGTVATFALNAEASNIGAEALPLACTIQVQEIF